MDTILHITSRDAWDAARTAGRYTAPSLEASGFIHCSTREQVVRVADFLFGGRTGLVLLVIDTDRLAAEVRTENLEGGEKLFPHVYGPIEIDAVSRALPVEPRADGTFELPEELARE